MSTLFLVGGVDRDEVEEILDRYEGVFDRRLELEDIGDFFVRLYSDRMSACALEASNQWNFEEGVSLVIHKSYMDSQSLDEILHNFFPVFNIVAVDESIEPHKLEEILVRLPSAIDNCRDKIKRMAHWMYHSHSGSCSSKMYTIMDHLQLVRRQSSSGMRRRIPKIISSIDFTAILTTSYDLDFETHWQLLSTWDFQPHCLTARELLYCAFILLKKLSIDAKTTISDNRLLLLLFTLEASYHQVNKFHNFKHAVDVMQATWQLCEHIIKDPLQTLQLCMAAIGHDIGHPGSNNQLLSKFDAPVANYYNKESVLENMHKDFFHDVLNDHWPHLLSGEGSSRNGSSFNIISQAILATDMALHAEYVDKLKEHNKIDDPTTLISLVIKAADISNVTRPLAISAQWACLITFEFNDCALLLEYEEKGEKSECSDTDKSISQESDQEIYKCITHVRFLSPDDLVAKYPCIPKGQIFFIDAFAEQFFQEFCRKFPHLDFLVDNIQSNKEFWLSKLEK